jgi:hypothetical protein
MQLPGTEKNEISFVGANCRQEYTAFRIDYKSSLGQIKEIAEF